MGEAVILNPDDQRTVNDGARFRQLRESPGYAELSEILATGVREAFMAWLDAPTADEMFELRGRAKALIGLTETIDARVHQADLIAQKLHESIEEARARQRVSLDQAIERRQRAAATAAL
jgi:hypothetical protein